MQLAKPFIKLPFQFDVERMQSELNAMPASAWMAHPSGIKGNSAIALISREGGDNDDFAGRMQVTPHLTSSAYLQQAIGSLGEVFGRSRLMRLAPGAEVAAHVDFNYHWYSRVRIHIPITTEPRVTFFCGDQSTHMAAGECWIFDSWRRHRVVNGGVEDRVHLVIDTAGSSRFWQMVQTADAMPVAEVTYNENWQGRVRTEQFNNLPVMSPGEIDHLVLGLIEDFSAHPKNLPQRVQHYTSILNDFRHNWREIYAEFGPLPEVLPRYQQLVTKLKGEMHRDPRALITHSNEVGVNPIIMQRIVRAALAPEMFEQHRVSTKTVPG